MIKENTGRDHTRSLVRMRDKHTCQDCGEIRTPKKARRLGKRLFDVHHLNGLCGKKSRGYDKVSEMGGLVTLCHGCHFARHDFSIDGKKKMERISPKLIKRNQKIGLLRKKGLSYLKIGQIIGLTHQRIHQIVQKSYQQLLEKGLD